LNIYDLTFLCERFCIFGGTTLVDLRFSYWTCIRTSDKRFNCYWN